MTSPRVNKGVNKLEAKGSLRLRTGKKESRLDEDGQAQDTVSTRS